MASKFCQGKGHAYARVVASGRVAQTVMASYHLHVKTLRWFARVSTVYRVRRLRFICVVFSCTYVCTCGVVRGLVGRQSVMIRTVYGTFCVSREYLRIAEGVSLVFVP